LRRAGYNPALLYIKGKEGEEVKEMEKKHTEVRLATPRFCDFCRNEGNEGKETVARYDGRTVYGAWAYMCPAHFRKYGVGLGLGKGQRLVYQKEEKK